MPTTQWGRNETILFPPHSPIYSYGVFFLSAILTGLFVFLHFHFAESALRQFYTPIYLRTAAGAVFHKKENY